MWMDMSWMYSRFGRSIKIQRYSFSGLYKPKHDIHSGGTQNYDDKTNVYAQLILQYIY